MIRRILFWHTIAKTIAELGFLGVVTISLGHLVFGWSALSVGIVFGVCAVLVIACNIYLVRLQVQKEQLDQDLATVAKAELQAVSRENDVLRQALHERYPPSNRPN